MHTDLVAALDIGGTKIAAALVDGGGALLVRAQRPTPARESAETVMGAVTEVLDELSGSPLWGRATAVGIGSAGPVDASAARSARSTSPAGATSRWWSGSARRSADCPWSWSATGSR